MAAAAFSADSPLSGAEPDQALRTYREAKDFLSRHTPRDRADRFGRRPRGGLPGVAGAGHDLDLRRHGRAELRLHPPRIHRGGQRRTRTSTTTAAKIASGSRRKAARSASGSSPAPRKTWTTGSPRRPSTRGRFMWPCRTAPRTAAMSQEMKLGNTAGTAFDLRRDPRRPPARQTRARAAVRRRRPPR